MSTTPGESSVTRHRKPRNTLKVAAVVVAAVAVGAVVLVVASGGGWLAFGQESDDVVPSEMPNPPQIVAISPSTDRIVPRATISITCNADHADPGTLVYQWSTTDGDLVGSGSEIQWIAPEAEGLHRVFVTVMDLHGGADEVSLSLFVRNNTPPEITALHAEIDDEPGWVIPGATIDLVAEARDVDGDGLTYHWSATAGMITGRGHSVVWMSPEETGTHWITVDVTDLYGGSARRAVPISVSRGEPPTILGFIVEALDTHQFEPHGDGWLILGEKSCSIEVLVDDDDGSYTYDWQSDRGEVVGDGSRAVFQAPPTGTSIIVVRVMNEMGSEASESVRIGTWSFSCCG